MIPDTSIYQLIMEISKIDAEEPHNKRRLKGEDNTVSASLVPADANCESRLKQVMSLSGFFADPASLYEEYELSFPQK